MEKRGYAGEPSYRRSAGHSKLKRQPGGEGVTGGLSVTSAPEKYVRRVSPSNPLLVPLEEVGNTPHEGVTIGGGGLVRLGSSKSVREGEDKTHPAQLRDRHIPAC